MIELEDWTNIKEGDVLLVDNIVSTERYIEEVRHFAGELVTVDRVFSFGNITIKEDPKKYHWPRKVFVLPQKTDNVNYSISISDLI